MISFFCSMKKISWCTFVIYIMILVVSLSAGCEKAKEERVKIRGFEIREISEGEIKKILPNTRLSITGKVEKDPVSLPVTYEWRCTKGEIHSDSEDVPSITYMSPPSEGPTSITLIAALAGREKDRGRLDLEIKSRENLSAAVPGQGTPVKPSEPVPTKSPPPERGDVSIVDPSDGTGVDQIITVSGRVRKLSDRESLTIFARPIPSDPSQSWWVQSPPNIGSDGSWTSSPVYIGLPDDRTGLPFRICAGIMTKRYQRGDQLRELPSGPKTCVNVRRR